MGMGKEYICRPNEKGAFFELVWLLQQRMATRSKVTILPKFEVISVRTGVFTCWWETGRVTFRIHNPYFCLFVFSSGL